MKVQIYNPQENERPIEGYELIEFDGDLNSLFARLDEICCDSEAESILAPQILSQCARDFPDLMEKLVSKVRSGGSAVFGGVELDAFAEAVRNNTIREMNLSEVVRRCQSMLRITLCHEMTQELFPGYICSWLVKGINYEITVSRP